MSYERRARGRATARRKLAMAAPEAAGTLIAVSQNADSADVRRPAAEAILDRAGVRAGIDVQVTAVSLWRCWPTSFGSAWRFCVVAPLTRRRSSARDGGAGYLTERQYSRRTHVLRRTGVVMNVFPVRATAGPCPGVRRQESGP